MIVFTNVNIQGDVCTYYRDETQLYSMTQYSMTVYDTIQYGMVNVVIYKYIIWHLALYTDWN